MADKEHESGDPMSGGGNPQRGQAPASGAGDGAERGQRATFDPQSGEVRGSGSGAGAGANPNEDYDGDPMNGGGGGGDELPGGPRAREDAVDRPIDKDEGV
ncbi:MAG TPA: hypothetical protein VGB62_03705 [Allosphingosinicella sp.]|jgi:hypothetical protein